MLSRPCPCSFEIVHITGCALGEKATNDRHVIKAIPHSVDGKQQGEVALGTLAAGRTDQFALDFGISRTTGFRHTGKSSVWLSGYLTRSFASDLGSDDEYSMDEDEDEDEDEESESESDDDEAPAAVPLIANGAPAAAAKVRSWFPAWCVMACFPSSSSSSSSRRNSNPASCLLKVLGFALGPRQQQYSHQQSGRQAAG